MTVPDTAHSKDEAQAQIRHDRPHALWHEGPHLKCIGQIQVETMKFCVHEIGNMKGKNGEN